MQGQRVYRPRFAKRRPARRWPSRKTYRTKAIMSQGALLGQCRVQLPWFSVGEFLTRTAQTSAITTYNLNSINQAHGTDTHQPMWHDKWAALYGTYRVYAAEYELTFDALGGSALTATTPEQLVWAYISKTGAPAFTTTAATNIEVESFIEMMKTNKHAHVGFLCPPGIDGRSSKVTFRGKIKFSDLHDDFADTVNDQSSFGGNPSEFVYLYTGITDMNGVVRTDSIKSSCKIMFHTLLTHPANQTQN